MCAGERAVSHGVGTGDGPGARGSVGHGADRPNGLAAPRSPRPEHPGLNPGPRASQGGVCRSYR